MTGEELISAASRLVVGDDGDDFVIGRPDLGVYVAVPEPGAAFVEALRGGASLEEATATATRVAGQEVDGAEFLAGLAEAGLLDPVRPAAAGQPAGGRGLRQIRWVEGVSQRSARRFFGPAGWIMYGAAVIFSVSLLALRPDLRPTYEHTWWLPDPVLSLLILFPINLLLTAAHEVWHWLAGRAAGVPAIFRVSYRGMFLVFETDLTQIVTTPRNRRYGAFLAGMAFDSVVLAVALGLRLANREAVIALSGLADRLLAAIVLTQVVRIVWQFAAVFMRSDMYAVLTNALRCHDLYRTTWLTVKDRLWRLKAEEVAELAGMGVRDQVIARWFGLVYLAGLIAIGWMVLYVSVPFMIGMVMWVAANLANPLVTSWTFWSSLALTLYIVVPKVMPVLLAVRERRLKKAGALR
ncbi:MAG: hypothetical protein HOZ81_53810 [Streptomyces sp.]|nr:hypothetical protein [Streptomyces sp.]NUP39223.1 hypothetical protein [Streptomyces sp.]